MINFLFENYRTEGEIFMKLMIDDAHIEQIKKIYEFYPVDGVTTNPSILYKVGRKPFDVLKEIREFIGENSEMHVQATA